MKNSLIKQEFFLWLCKLNQDDLSANDKRIINLLIIYLDEIIPLGTARGTRAKKIGYLIENNYAKLSTDLPDFNGTNIKDFVKPVSISELIIGPFRGFTSEETITFEKKYIFMYGPNGSGKTSFCEGLEYALLGRIEEADSRRIDIKDYIKNVVVGRSNKPILRGINEHNQMFEIPENPNAYRFCFIERSRIDGFSRIAANTPKVQQDRISTLFGIDDFNAFVSNFPDTIEEKYLTRTNPKKTEYDSIMTSIEASITRKYAIEESFNKISIQVEELLKEARIANVDSLEKLKIYLGGEDGTKGRINELFESKGTKIPENIDEDIIKKHIAHVEDIKNNIGLMSNQILKLERYSSELNFKDLYTALLNINLNSDVDNTICPACKTPIINVEVNPFSNASIELDKMKELALLQDSIGKLKFEILKEIRDANKRIAKINENKRILKDSNNLFTVCDESSVSESWQMNEWLEYFKLIQNKQEYDIKQNKSLQQSIIEYNMGLEMRRKSQVEIDSELRNCIRYKQIYDRLIASKDSLTAEISEIDKKISDSITYNEKLIKEIEIADETIKVHTALLQSYESIINKLKSYMAKLPSEMSAGLSDKAKEFYNIINSHDQDFERLQYLKIPTSPGENIRIRFIGDKNEHNALLILSEGHVRILGLAILLAKVVKDDLSFIVYDDIVNAIDDEHKDGVSELIINNPDMKKRQHILTCHGDLFINKLEHKLGVSATNREVKRYRFNPSDCVDERGVKISIGQTKHYISLARIYYKDDARKDAAFKCRQALESISEALWKKMGDKLNISLTVKMRTPGTRPDLSTVVDSLIKEFSKLNDTKGISEDLKSIKEKYPWTILNKGTHEQVDLPEFERKDILDCIEILERLESNTGGLKFTITLV